jgi:hypothetical protein
MTDKPEETAPVEPAKMGDPADKTSGVDQFQPTVNHRAGYGDKYSRVYDYAKRGATLHSGEGRFLTDRIDQLELEVKVLLDEINVLQRRYNAPPEEIV